MPRPEDESCSNCQCWFRKGKVQGGKSGLCQCHAPRYISTEALEDWAVTKEDRWCGDWRPVAKED